ncbi:hypothetical protein CLW00_11287 [Mongoliibacter ruber]|uniref:Uncharacterized protein n=1 Tax=Mongoliibacter ruber TaxID=1750599 RepID=A0A2T0WFQ1_9BACT|nr:hypothetical protein CLW00_11287 [Mongoliibacter ruber]
MDKLVIALLTQKQFKSISRKDARIYSGGTSWRQPRSGLAFKTAYHLNVGDFLNLKSEILIQKSTEIQKKMGN